MGSFFGNRERRPNRESLKEKNAEKAFIKERTGYTQQDIIINTEKAFKILKSCYDGGDKRKESESLSQVLEYMDRRTGEKKCFVMRDPCAQTYLCCQSNMFILLMNY